MRIHVFHNILWPRYKGSIFGAMYRAAPAEGLTLRFTHIAETESDQAALGGVDHRYHAYPHEVIFPGNYFAAPLWKRAWVLARQAAITTSDFVVLPGYHRLEYWLMLAVLMVRGKPRAVFCDSTANDQPKRIFRRLAKRAFFSRCQGFFGYGVRSRDYLLMHGAPSERIRYRCQAAALAPDYDEARVLSDRRAALSDRSVPPHVLFVGRLAPEKGLDTLLAAFRLLRDRRPDVRLRVAGSGPMQRSLVAQARQLGVDDAIEWLGSLGISELSREYVRATVLALPSTSEAWGLVVNEALSHGCPAVVSDVCGCVPELIVDGKTGYRFAVGDADQLAVRLAAAIQDVTEGRIAAQTCVEHMQAYTPQVVAQEILSGCRQFLARARV